MNRTRGVGQFIVGLEYQQIPAEAVRAARWALVDSIGVTLAGSHERAVDICVDEARADGPPAEATLFGRKAMVSATMAAYVNGVAGHALDFDWVFPIQGQPMAGLMPAVLAAAESVHADGRDVLAAYLAGFEVTAKLARVVEQAPRYAGWHATSTIGSVGCAVAASRLLRLTVDQTCAAIGIASSMAGGLVWNFGTMAKPLHAGLAPRNGLQAARLAQRGLTANPAMLEGPDGFIESFAGREVDPGSLDDLGASYEILGGIVYKPYPCGGLAHSAIDAVLALRRDAGLHAGLVDRIDVRVTRATARRIVYVLPRTELEAKFSMPYLVARALVDGSVDLGSFNEDAILDPIVCALAERVHMTADPDLPDVGLGHQPCEVLIYLRNGETLLMRVAHRSPAESSMGEAELRHKFATCAQRVLTESASSRALDLMESLETVAEIAVLTRVLSGSET